MPVEGSRSRVCVEGSRSRVYLLKVLGAECALLKVLGAECAC